MRTIVLASLCIASTATAAPRIGDVVGGAAPDDPHPRSTYKIAPGGGPTALPSSSAAGAPLIIYMNRMGGIYRPGDNDARTNHSTIPGFAAQVNPWNVSAAGWQQVMTCIRDQFARFNVTITDVDPGNVPHLESVVAGYPQDVGMGQGVGGVSPFTDDCSTIPNSIVFTFAEVYGTAYRDICETAAQEISHSFGLDHEYECRDPMTYLSGCGPKTFQAAAVRCGEYSARTCTCGNPTQNSVAMLTARIGAHNAPPTVAITAPADGATVRPGFTVDAGATDTGTVTRVELWIDGAQAGTDSAPPFSFTTSPTLADGPHALEVRAFDDGEATASSSIDVTVAADPTDPGPGSGSGSGSDDPITDEGDLSGGCSTGGPGALSAGLLLAAAFLIRRRR